MAAALWRSLGRRKPLPPTSEHGGPRHPPAALARVLTAWDLTALGVGSTLGVGIYVLAGDVARRQAGPAVLLSFVVAGLASGLAGLCYAEFGSRVPLAGSAYVYSYVSVGELLAFVIGWSLVLEYAIGSASVARALTSYVDQLTGHVMERAFQKLLPMYVPFLATYADPVAFAVAFGLAVILAFGVRESLSLNNLFAALNMAVIIFVVVAGAFKADPKNWSLSPEEGGGGGGHVGNGGFMPFGISGVLRGAATCFYGFIGFDCIAATGEEVRRPHKAIPVAILGSLLVVCLSYLAVSAVITLMWPYYDLKDDGAPLAYVFHQVGWPIAQWIVAIGGIFGLITSLFGTMFPLPRVIYAMATDGLIFRFLGNVHSRFQTPFVGTLVAGFLTGIIAALFHLQQLVDMLSIGTLMAYTLVATCVLLLRYRASEDDETSALLHEETDVRTTTTTWGVCKQLVNSQGLKSPTSLTGRIVSGLTVIYCLCSVIFAVLLTYNADTNARGLIPLGLVASIMTLLLIFISLQPSSIKSIPFKVPLVPILPALSISMNVYLMLLLDRPTWIRFAVWMVIGCLLWVVYIACRCCFPEAKHKEKKESYDNDGFDPDEALGLPNGAVSYDVTDTAGDFVVVDEIPLKNIHGHNGQVLDETRPGTDTPETAKRITNRFVRPTSVIQGELSLESVSELAVKGNSQSDNVNVAEKKGRLHRPNSVQEGRISFEYAAESDVLSIDSDAHSLYPEVFIVPTEDEKKERKVIQEETDEGEDREDSSSVETSEGHVPGEETRSQSMTDLVGVGSKSPSSRSLSRNGSLLESDDRQQSVSIPTKPDPGQVMESPRNDQELSHPAETVALPDSQVPVCASETTGLPLSERETEERRLPSGIENLETGNADSEGKAIADDLPSPSSATSHERNSPIPKDEDTSEDIETPRHINIISPETLKSPNRNTSKNKSPLPNFSISSFDNKSIDNGDSRKKFRSPSLRNAMAAGSFSDSSFVERLNDVIAQRSGSTTPSDLKRETSVKPVKENDDDDDDDDLEDDVFISSDVPPKQVVRERLESLLSNISARTPTTRFEPEQLPQKVAKKQPEARKVEDHNLSQAGREAESPESTSTEKLDAIMKRRGSLPPKKRKDKEELLSGGHTLPERRNSKIESDDVPSKAEIRRTLENLFSNDPKRGVSKVEEMSTVL